MSHNRHGQPGSGSLLDDRLESNIVVNSNQAEFHSALLRGGKRAVDIAIALAFFMSFGWLYVFVWLGVLLTSGAPAMYAQQRYGRKGEVFKFYKFRSMVVDSDDVLDRYLKSNPAAAQQWNDFQKLEKDPRVTAFGRFIRKTSLDELPQFWNVLIGDMSVVGPRPCMVNQRSLYGSSWNHYCAVRPGITGLWQVSGRNKLSFNARVELDVKYVETLSVRKDISILFKTVLVVFTGHGSF